jgi:HlyD family type I secretion membrane fusion protein
MSKHNTPLIQSHKDNKDLDSFLCEDAFSRYYSVHKIIMSFVIISVLALFLVRLDIIISAKGKIIPCDNIQSIQSMFSGKVKKICFKEGDFIKRDNVIIEIDPTEDDVNIRNAQEKITEKQTHIDSIKNVLNSLHNSEDLKSLVSVYTKENSIVKSIVQKQVECFLSELAGLSTKEKSIEEEVMYLQTKLAALENITFNKKEKLSGYKELLEKGFTSKLMFFSVKEELIAAQTQENDIKNELQKVKKELQGIARAKELLSSNVSQNLQKELLSLENELREVKSIYDKVLFFKNNRDVKMPADGYLDKLLVTHVGEVVSASRELAVITPTKGGLEIECYIQSKDIGFVEKGQQAVLKIDAYPYSIYGSFSGKVIRISKTSFQKENEFLYKAKIVFDHTDSKLQVASGMTVECDIVTGNRKFIHYFVSPVYEVFNSALKER